ncbi:MAG: DMT family transporter [Pyrobaculum sp.]
MWPYLNIFLAAFLWSTIGLAAHFGGDYVWMAILRMGIAAVFTVAAWGPPRRGGLLPGLLLGGLCTSYLAAAIYAGVGPAAYLLYTAPLWATAILYTWGERPSRLDVLGVALILVAVAMMWTASAAGEINPLGFAAGLAAGIFYGSYIAVARRYAKEGREAEASLGAMPYSPLATLPLFAIAKNHVPTLEATVAGIYLAIFATLIPYRLFTSAVTKVSGSKASVVASMEAVLAALWGVLLLGQTPGIYTTAAYMLITTAILLSLKKTT